MSENDITKLIDKLIAYENFIKQIKQNKQAKSLELAQHISAIMEPNNTFFYKNRRKINEIFKQNGGNQLSRKTKKYIYNTLNYVSTSRLTTTTLHSLLITELSGDIQTLFTTENDPNSSTENIRLYSTTHLPQVR